MRLQWHLSSLILFVVIGSAFVFANLQPSYPPTDPRKFSMPEGRVSGVGNQGWPFVCRQIFRVQPDVKPPRPAPEGVYVLYHSDPVMIEKWYTIPLIGNIVLAIGAWMLAVFAANFYHKRKRRSQAEGGF